VGLVRFLVPVFDLYHGKFALDRSKESVNLLQISIRVSQTLNSFTPASRTCSFDVRGLLTPRRIRMDSIHRCASIGKHNKCREVRLLNHLPDTPY
jgi:hypothetical protein